MIVGTMELFEGIWQSGRKRLIIDENLRTKVSMRIIGYCSLSKTITHKLRFPGNNQISKCLSSLLKKLFDRLAF